MEQDARLAPFIRAELPHLACRKDTDNTVPGVCAELVESLDRINDIIPLSAGTCLSTWLYRGAFAVDRYEVLCPSGTLCSSTRTGLGRWLESETRSRQLLIRTWRERT